MKLSLKKILFGLLFVLVVMGIYIGANGNTTKNKEEGGSVVNLDDKQLTIDYCNNRKDSYRNYAILDLVEGENGKAELKPVGLKRGKDLTQSDCTMIITALLFTQKRDSIEKVIGEQMWVGMDKLELGWSAGQPDRIITNSDGQDVWIYTGSGGRIMTYYFRNGILEKWIGDM